MRKKGFTIVEMIVVITVLSVVMTLVIGSFVSLQRQANFQMEYSRMSSKLSLSTDFIEKQIRMIGFDPKGSGAFGIIQGDSQYIYYTYDENEDGAYDDSLYSIRLQNDSLYFYEGKNRSLIIAGVDSFRLTYYGERDSLLATPVAEIDTTTMSGSRIVRKISYYIVINKTYMGKPIKIKTNSDVVIKNMGG
ncbi:prepilin-type N-terminal cleavage/methylation domain-containing protein [candidate division WOR-3 bacterium]|nr:prepilin-type N-terminal cleavage/methylation domain-containing protein [candidate division WOR-3 bacterium]